LQRFCNAKNLFEHHLGRSFASNINRQSVSGKMMNFSLPELSSSLSLFALKKSIKIFCQDGAKHYLCARLVP